MLKKNKLLVVTLLMLSQLLFAYLSFGKEINGKVTDEEGVPIIGVNVIVQGTTIGTTTNSDGEYQINASSESTLIFSFIGYNEEKVIIGDQSVINVALTSDVTELEDIVVVGYGSMKKSDITGSVVSVDTENMLKKSPTNILEGLKGQAAGVMVIAQDGAPDANAAIRIRGVATINGSAKPLYVIDGVQVGDNANFLNPRDIESIEILKDASATAIYGAAGANGVIMITTKHGKPGDTKINFSVNYGIQTLSNALDVCDVDQYAKNIRTARANDGASLANEVFSEQYDGQRKYIDWQKELTRVSLKQHYNLSASGGTENTQSNVSLSFLNNDGIIINSNYKRLTARANVVTKVADFLEIGGNINYVHSESHGSNASWGNNGNLSSLRDLAFICPTMDYVDPGTGQYVSPNVINDNGTYGVPMQSSLGQHDGGIADNIYAEQMENNGLNRNNRIITSAYANLELFKGLSFKSIASYNYSTTGWRNFYGNKQRYEPDGETKIELTNYDTRTHLDINQSQYNTLALESYLTYKWENEFNSLTFMAGNSVRRSFGTYVSASAVGFPGENIRKISLTNDIDSKTGDGYYNDEVRNISYFGRASYSMKDRYILTTTIRRDGSSNFGAGNRWGTFPSAAFAWRISEESFLENNSTISNLKLRLGWGQTGNSGDQGDKAVAALTSETIAYYLYNQNGVSGLGSTRQTANGLVKLLADTNLKWETNEQSNIGIDLGLFDNSLNITTDYFVRTSKDLLLYRAIRPSAGYTEVYTNYGEIQNKGIEFSINYTKKVNNNWKFDATLTGSSLENKIIKMGADLFNSNTDGTNDGSNVGAVAADAGVHWTGHSICREGYAVGSFYGYKVEGIFQSQDEVDAANTAAVEAGHTQYQYAETTAGDFKYKDINNDGFIDESDQTILGNGFPKVNYGLTLNTSYKNWDFSVISYGVLGQEIYSYAAMTLSNMVQTDNGTTPNILREASEQAWTESNNSTTLSRLSILDKNYNMSASDKWVKNGDFFKISNIQVGYTFSKTLLNSLRIQSARIYASVQNVVTFSSYNKYGNPEAGQGSVLYTGLDTGRYPYPRVYSFGLNIQF